MLKPGLAPLNFFKGSLQHEPDVQVNAQIVQLRQYFMRYWENHESKNGEI